MRDEGGVKIRLKNTAAWRRLLDLGDDGGRCVPQRFRETSWLHLSPMSLGIENRRTRVEVSYFTRLVFNNFGQYAGCGANGHRGTLLDSSS